MSAYTCAVTFTLFHAFDGNHLATFCPKITSRLVIAFVLPCLGRFGLRIFVFIALSLFELVVGLCLYNSTVCFHVATYWHNK